jgi:hypothetical protein
VLLSNYSILNRNCDAFIGSPFTNPLAQFKAMRFPNFYCGDSSVTGETNKSAFNNGYAVVGQGGSMWHLSPKAGGLSCRTIYGTGTLTASLTMGKALAAALTGSGGISTATLSLIVSLAAALTGSGTISAASLKAIAGLSAALSGSGSISAAAMSLIVSLEADLTGSGSLTGALRGTASLAADITVTGTGLSTANVGDAVWAYILASGYTASQAMDVLTAVAAGKVSGAPGSPVFRSLDDTRNVVSGVADTDGNRTASTITAEG